MRLIPPLLLSAFLSLATSLAAQSQFHTTDLVNFRTAYDRITATRDTAAQRRLLNEHFIDKASPGQRAMFAARRYTPDEYLLAIRTYPRFWASMRANLANAESHVPAMRDAAQRLRTLYPSMSPADVYFTVGVFRSGGTITDGMVLIGSEIALADSATVTDEFPPSLDHLPGVFATNPATELDYVTVHELVHTVQPGRWGYDLLSQAVHEGIAEFVASVAMGVPSPAQSVRYGEAHRDTVRAVFEQELFSPWRDRWIWNDTTGPFPVRDLGYYVGYAMAQRHFAQSNDTARALATMLTLNAEDSTAVQAFVERSGWLTRPLSELRRSFDAARPRVTHISEFANGNTAVDPATSTITLHFDRPMATGYRSTGAGPSPDAQYPTVSRIRFADDGRSVVYEVRLQPATVYEMELEIGYRDERLFPLVPHRVRFETSGRRPGTERP